MALSTVQLAVLNSLMGESRLFGGDAGELENKTLGELIDELVERRGLEECSEAKRAVIEHAAVDADLRGLSLVDKDSYDERGSKALCWRDGQGELYVVFSGSGTGDKDEPSIDGEGTNSEWYTDAMGLTQADTDPQVAAKSYVDYVSRRYNEGDPVTVTGHSNGGNKAMYCAIATSSVKAAIAFDGQGFSPAFFNKYASEIDRNKGKIEFFGAEGDYVGPLLKSLPIEKQYVKHGTLKSRDGIVDNLKNNHDIDSLLTEQNGSFVLKAGSASVMSVEVEKLVTYLYATRSPEELEVMSPLFGQILDSSLGTQVRTIDELWNDSSLTGAWALLIDSLLMYEGLENLLAVTCDTLVDNIAPDVAAQSGPFSPSSLGNLLRRRALLFNAATSNVGRVRRWLRGYQTWKNNVATGGASGNRDSVREFTESKRQELVGIVRDVESEPWYDPTRWDAWYRGERWFGLLTIQNYQHDMNAFYRKTVDVDGVTVNQINTIFDAVETHSRNFSMKEVPVAFVNSLRDIEHAMKTLV